MTVRPGELLSTNCVVLSGEAEAVVCRTGKLTSLVKAHTPDIGETRSSDVGDGAYDRCLDRVALALLVFGGTAATMCEVMLVARGER